MAGTPGSPRPCHRLTTTVPVDQIHRNAAHITGILEIGSPDGTLVRGTLASARFHRLEHDVLAAAELMRRFPAFKVPADYIGIFQPDGGWLALEAAFEAWMSLATRAGAQIRTTSALTLAEPFTLNSAGGAISVGGNRNLALNGPITLASAR